MEIFERHIRNCIVTKKENTQQSECHHNQRCTKEWVNLSDKLVHWKERCDKVVGDDNCEPSILRENIELCREDIRRANHEHHTYQQEQYHREYAHKRARTLAEVATNNLSNAQTVVAHENHTREVVVHRTHKDTAKGNPEERHWAVARTEDSTKDWARTRNIEQLDQECAPARHRHIVYAVVEFRTWHLGFCIYFADLIEVLSVGKICHYKQRQTKNKSYHN